MKVLLSFVVVFVVISATKDKFTIGSRFRAVECTSDNETISFDYCNIKAFSAKVAAMNLGVNFLQNLTKPLYVQIIFSYRFGNIYRSMVDSKRVEFCAIMDGFSENPIIKLITDVMKKDAPFALRKCPFTTGLLEIKNLTADNNNLHKIFPRGLYKLELMAFKNTKEIAGITAFFETKDAEKFSGTRFRSIECAGDNDTILFEYCYVKAYSTSFITINIGVNYLKAVYKPIHVQVIFSYRKGGVFQGVIDSKKIEFCSIMVGINENPFLKAITEDLAKAVPEILHPCPYKTGFIHLKNITAGSREMQRITPNGVYKMNLTVWKYTKLIAQVTIIYELKKDA